MRALTIIFVLSFVLSACVAGGSEATPTPLPPDPTAAVEPTVTPTHADPTATEPLPEATATSTLGPTATEPPPANTPEPTSTDVPDDQEDIDVDAIIREIGDQTALLRELPMLEDINVAILSREELGANMLALLEEHYSREEAEIDRDLLWIMRLIPDRDLDFWELQVSLRSGLVLGYYDHRTGFLAVVDDEGRMTPGLKMTISHEIVHAIQDQHFDLSILDDEILDDEALFAYRSLVEGDAYFTEVQWVLTHMTQAEIQEYIASFDDFDSSLIDSLPRYVRESIYFPYEAGWVFVEALYEQGGWDAVDAAYHDPPVSTEQIIHPEKYLSDPRDMPLPVEMPDVGGVLGDEWENVSQGVLGEFDLLILLEENGILDGWDASNGWGGAEYVMYTSGSDLFFVMETRWDTLEDAEQFHEALQQTMSGYAQLDTIYSGDSRHHAILADSDAVTLFTSTSLETLQTVLAAQ